MKLIKLNSLNSIDIPILYNTFIFSNHYLEHLLNISFIDEESNTFNYLLNSVTLYFEDYSGKYYKLPILNKELKLDDTLDIKFTYDLPETKYNKLVITVELEDGVLITQSFKINFKTLISKNFNFKIKRKLEKISEPNFSLERVKADYPSWSKVYKDDVSNVTKVLDPLFKQVESIYSKTENLLKKNLKDLSTISLNESPLLVVDESNNKYFEHINILNSNYKTINLKPIENLQLITYFVSKSLITEDLDFINDSLIYLQKDIKNTQEKIIIEGLNKDNKFISESLILISDLPRNTINKYSKITKIVSNVNLIVSNHLDCSKNHQILDSFNLPTPSFVTKDLGFINYFPKFELQVNSFEDEDSKSNILVIKEPTTNQIKYKYSFTDQLITSMFIDDNLNVYTLTDSALKIGNLSIDNTKYNTNITTNNNKFIIVENKDILINEWQKVYIDIEALSKNIDICYISVENEDTLYYYNPEYKSMQLEKYLINTQLHKDIYTLDIYISNENPYIFTIHTKDKKYNTTLEANVINNKNSYNTSNKNMILFNNKLLLVDIEEPLLESVDKNLIIFNWTNTSDLDFELNIKDIIYTNNDINIQNKYIKNIAKDGNNYIETLSINYKEIAKDYFDGSSLTFKVKSNWSPHTLPSANAQAWIYLNINNNSIRLELTPKDTTEYEYTIVITDNTITSTRNSNYD